MEIHVCVDNNGKILGAFPSHEMATDSWRLSYANSAYSVEITSEGVVRIRNFQTGLIEDAGAIVVTTLHHRVSHL